MTETIILQLMRIRNSPQFNESQIEYDFNWMCFFIFRRKAAHPIKGSYTFPIYPFVEKIFHSPPIWSFWPIFILAYGEWHYAEVF